MNRQPLTLILYLLIGLGALAGLYGGWKRYQSEGLNRRVEMCLDYTEVRTLADMTGKPALDVLKRFKRAGITSIALTEDTINGLDSLGVIVSRPRFGQITSVLVATPDQLRRITQALNLKGVRSTRLDESKDISPAGDPVTVLGERPADPGGVAVWADYASLRPLGVGLEAHSLTDVMDAELQPVARIGTWPSASAQSMSAVLQELSSQGIKTVIFQGTDVLGYRGAEKDAAEAIRRSGLNYGQIEFGKQRGDDKLSMKLKGEYIRVHSISEAELGTLDENEIVDRFVRAARERNIRLCYLRLPFTAGSDPVGANITLIERIRDGIARGREVEFGIAHPYRETAVPGWAFIIMALGAAAGFTLLLIRLTPPSLGASIVILALAAVISVGLVAGVGETGRKLVALLAGVAFPTLACLRRDVLGAVDSARLSVNQAAGRALAGLAAASAVTAVGIAHVVGLLATRPFMVKANQFMGIKAQHAIPILVVGALAITGLPALDRAWAEEKPRYKERLARFFGEPARVGQLVLVLIGLALFALIVARTGNEPGVGVSGLELKFRSLLDRFLPIRPRTKEFLIGHPAFVLALAFWFRGRRKIALPLFVVGVIGQVSILNTFCHIHTPLTLSVIRDITGLVAGAIIGLALFWIIERMLPAPGGQPAAAGGPP